jgi:hypothetical protein
VAFSGGVGREWPGEASTGWEGARGRTRLRGEPRGALTLEVSGWGEKDKGEAMDASRAFRELLWHGLVGG